MDSLVSCFIGRSPDANADVTSVSGAWSWEHELCQQ